jgi:hypothetical protein
MRAQRLGDTIPPFTAIFGNGELPADSTSEEEILSSFESLVESAGNSPLPKIVSTRSTEALIFAKIRRIE